MKEMTVEEHLADLRTAVIRILWILGFAFALCCYFGEEITEFMLVPLRKGIGTSHAHGQIVFHGIFDKVVAEFQVAFWFSILVSSPLWFREVWNFIRPALKEHEIKAVRPFIFISFVFFVLGILFGYYILFPFTLSVLLDYGVQGVVANLSLKDYLLLSSQILVFLGVLFQLPNIMIILGFMGLVTKYSLKKWRPYLYVLFSIVSALITPPDVFSMMLAWVPIVILYEIGLMAVTLIVHPYLEKRNT